MENSHWKTIQSFEQLERFLRANPKLRIYDTHDRESRYVIRESFEKMTVATVDGRSFRAIFLQCDKAPDGSWQLRTSR